MTGGALAATALVALLLYPHSGNSKPSVTAAAAPVAPTDMLQSRPTVYLQQPPVAPRTVTVPDGSLSSSSAGGYSCGSTGGYSIWVNNGNVPCTSAVMVTTQWLRSGTTPGGGAGSAGTPYSWTCTSSTSSVGYCTSKMGSTFTIDR